MSSRFYGTGGGSRTRTQSNGYDDGGLRTGPISGKRRFEDDSNFSDTEDIDDDEEEDGPCSPPPEMLRQPSPRRNGSSSTVIRSPSRGVRFGRGSRIETGPTPSDPTKPRQPLRSAMSPERSIRSASTIEGPWDSAEHSNKKLRQQSPTGISDQPGLDLVNMSDAERDNRVCDAFHHVRELIWRFAGDLLHDIDPEQTNKTINVWLQDVNFAPTFRYVGMLALGGPSGRLGWDKMMADGQCLQALILGVVGRALKEHVFGELWFGGSKTEIDHLDALQVKGEEMDGFHRTRERGAVCQRFLKQPDDKHSLPSAIATLTAQLLDLLKPFVQLTLDPDGTTPVTRMHQIVTIAAHLARAMRCLPDVVYYFPPTFKDEEFDPERMECLNLAAMISHSPYKRKVQKGGYVTAELDGDKESSEAIVQIVAFPGLVAYRQGGGELAKSQLADERRCDGSDNAPPDVRHSRRMARDSPWSLTGDEGFRSRILCKGVVHLMWGQQRLLTKEAGTSRYLDAVRDGNEAKYEVDRAECVELYDIFLKENGMASRAIT